MLESAREFLGNRFVYALVSARAHGLALGVNMNPDQACNFDCVYCEVVRRESRPRVRLTADQVAEELRRTLALVQAGELAATEPFRRLPLELLRLKQVNLSGEGEPTLCPDFCEIAQAVVHVRACSGLPFFKIVLFTNATALDRPALLHGAG